MAENGNIEGAAGQTGKPVGEDDQTARIPRPGQAGDKGKVVLNSSTNSGIKPSDATRIAPAVPQPGDADKPPVSQPKPKSAKTIKLKPVSEAVADDDQDVGETISVDRKDLDVPKAPTVAQNTAAPIAKPAKSKTIKLKPLKPNAAPTDDDDLGDTLSLDRDSLADIPSDSVKSPSESSGGLEDEATIKIQKPSSAKPAHPVPNVPGGKETIKLRPSNNTPPPPASPSAPTVSLEEAGSTPKSEGKRTIKLVPKKPESGAAQNTPKPSDPTVKLKEVAETPAAPPPSPSAPTMKMPKEEEPAAKPAGGKPTLKLKSSSASAPEPPKDATAAEAAETDTEQSEKTETQISGDISSDSVAEEPNIIFTLVAFVSLLLLAYFAYLAGTQFMALNG